MADRVVLLERVPAEQIAVLPFDRPPLNAIDEQVATALAAATAELTADSKPGAALVRSALAGVFMAAADIPSSERPAADGVGYFLVEPDELETRAREYAVRLARQAPIALRGIKRAIRAAASPEGLAVEGEAFREVLASEDAQTGVKAFLDGERP